MFPETKQYTSFSVWRKKPIRPGAISELGRIGRNGVGLESIAISNVAAGGSAGQAHVDRATRGGSQRNTHHRRSEFTRLQFDSALRSAAVLVPTGTYHGLAVTFSDVLLTYCAQPSSGVAGCSRGSLTQVPGSAGAATASSDALPLTVTSGEKLGLGAGCEYPERYHCERPDYFSGKSSCPQRAHSCHTGHHPAQLTLGAANWPTSMIYTG
jgi:hypothetical protein